MKGKGKQQI